MTDLPTATLGRSDLDITRVGFGAWALGGGDWAAGWGEQDDEESVAAIRQAVEAGVNWIDTAAVYGLGRSEQVVARALKDLPEADRPYVFTKCGMVWTEDDRMAPPRRVGAPDSIRHEVDASLRRLQVDRIDLYQVHWPPLDGTSIEELWTTMGSLVREGKVRAVGVSNFDVAQLDAASIVGQVDSVQPPFSALARDSAGDVIPWCLAHGVGVIVYSPMHSGLLTGKWSRERSAGLASNDWRSGDDDFQGGRLLRNLEVADVLVRIAERHDVTPAAVAVAWTLAFPGVTGAIVGARRPDQVDGWLPAADLRLSQPDLDEVADVLERTGAGSGPKSPSG